MKLIRILALGVPLMLMVTISANAAETVKPGNDGSIIKPISQPAMNKEEPKKINDCGIKGSSIPASTGNEAGTATGVTSSSLDPKKMDCQIGATEVKLPKKTE